MPAHRPLRYYVATPRDSALVHESVEFREQFQRANREVAGIELVDRPGDADIVVLFEAWSFKLPAYAQTLLDSEFLRAFAERVLVVNYDDAGTAFLPGCYTSLTTRTFNPARYRASCYPKAYNPHVETVAQRGTTQERRWLCTFRGNTQHQPVRQRMLTELQQAPGFQVTDPQIVFHAHDRASQLAYLEEIAASEFVLCPRGESPSTYRMFEVMQMGRCPVIVSDDWQPIEGIDWESCSLRIPERDLASLPQVLAARRHAARTLGEQARQVWEQHFEDGAKYRLYATQLAELHRARVVQGGDDLAAMRRLWSSREFRWQRGWTLPQRLARAPRRAARIMQSFRARPPAATAATGVNGAES